MRAIKILSLIVSYLIFGQLIHSCMETVQPEDVNKRILKTAVFRMIDQNTGETVPVRGAEVIVYEEVGGVLNEFKKIQTNDNGIATLELEVPLIGKLYSIRATYNNESQNKNSVLICSDTAVSFLFNDNINNITCSNLNQTDSLIFFDNDGTRRLKKNTPVNVNQYERCQTYTIDNNNSGPVTVQLPTVTAPFSVINIFQNDVNLPLSTKMMTLAPGEKFSICFAVSTTNAGQFNLEYPIAVNCINDNIQGTTKLILTAEVVEPTCECEDYLKSSKVLLEERVMVGQSFDFKDIEVFTNNSACTVVISKLNDSLTGGWTINSPTFPVTLAKGGTLKISGKFAPTGSGTSYGKLNLNIQPQGNSNDCLFEVNLEGEGCYNSCPFFGMDNRFQLSGFGKPVGDTISNRTDGKVFVSSTNLLSSAYQSYFVKNPDDACSAITINVELLPKDNYARAYFTVSPTQLTLAPGEFGQIDVSFMAPTVAEMQTILQARKGAGPYTTADSMFTTRLRIRGGTCTQDVDIDAIVTAFPDISPIINLRAYNQSTIQKPLPENEVYYFGYGSRSIVKGKDGSNGPYPPTLGDIWIDIDDNSQGASKPQNPILKLANPAIQVKLWKSGYKESDFSDVPSLITEFVNDPNIKTGYGPGPITSIDIEDVYTFKFDEFTYALIYIRRVDTGVEQTSSLQSGIEFRAIYPIYVY